METPGPHNIQLNALKHHIGAIVRLIAGCPVTELSQRLKVLGNSQMDLYLGHLTEEDISQEVLAALQALHIDTEAGYRQWLIQHHHYRSISLSDKSVWILRLGHDNPKYIHLHPGRYSPGTVRVKATVLKTAITLWIYRRNGLIDVINDIALNRVRKEVLQLSPVRSLEESRAVLKFLGILEAILPANP